MVESSPSIESTAQYIGTRAQALRTRIDASIKAGNTNEAVSLYLQIRQDLITLQEGMKELEELHTEAQHQIIPSLFDSTGVSSLTVHGQRVTVSQSLRASIIPDRKEDAYQWLRDSGHGDAITRTVNAGTLSSIAQGLIRDQGRELPEDMFRTYPYQTTSVTKVKRGDAV